MMRPSVLLLLLFLIGAFCDETKLQWSQLPNQGQIPEGAAGASLTEIKGRLYLFGGVQECAVVNSTASRWRHSVSWSNFGGMIDWMASVVRPFKTWDQFNQKILSISETEVPWRFKQLPGDVFCIGNRFFNSVSYYDLHEETWVRVNATGDVPAPRAFQRAVSFGDFFYMYGGVEYSSIDGTFFIPFGDFRKFDTRNNVWTSLPNDPGIRVDPGLAVDKEGHIYLGFGLASFGGGPEDNCKNDLWRYKISTNTWTLLSPNQPFNPNVPPVRYQSYLHVNDKNGDILSHGGDVLPDNRRHLLDTHRWDISQSKWFLLDNSSFLVQFTGASATIDDVFYSIAGEMRFGWQVACVNLNTSVLLEAGKKNNPINTIRAIQYTQVGATYQTLHPIVDGLETMQQSYYRVRDVLYTWGGFNFGCLSSGAQGATQDHVTFIRYFNHTSKLTLLKSLY